MRARISAAQAVAAAWRRHHHRMHRDDHYSHVVIQALVAAAWQESMSRVGQTAARAAAEIARSRIRNR